MKPKSNSNSITVILELRTLHEVELEFGFCIPLSFAWRLCKRSKSYVYRLADEGKLKTVNVCGVKFVPVRDLEEKFK